MLTVQGPVTTRKRECEDHRSGIDGRSGPGWRRCAIDPPGLARIALVHLRRTGQDPFAVSRAMTNGMSGRRRRTAVSLSMPVRYSAPIDQLNRVIETLHVANRTLMTAVPTCQELIALSGLLVQINGALLTFTDLLNAPADHHNHAHRPCAGTEATAAPRSPAGDRSLQRCRDAILAAHTASEMFHADVRRCPQTTAVQEQQR